MTSNFEAQPCDQAEQRHRGSRGHDVGPQGAALILELERLQEAFGTGELRRKTDRPASSRAIRSKPRKGKMTRAIKVCLKQFGLSGRAPPDREGLIVGDRIPPELPRRRSPAIAPADPLATSTRMLEREQPESGGNEIANIDVPRSPVPRLVAMGRTLAGGVAFLAAREGAALRDAPDEGLASWVGTAFRHELRTGLRVLIAVIVVAGGWGALVPLAAAVVVPGNLVVQSNVKTIQHPTGGIVAEIAVHDGMRVEAGQLLVRLDATQARASLQVVSKQLDDFRVRIARLVAERDGVPQPEIPSQMAARAAEPEVRILLASEQSLFMARATARQSQKDLLQSRIAQLGEENSGLEAQLKSKAAQIELIAGELKGVQDLFDKRLVPLTRLTTLQRESARIEGERGQVVSAIAETKAKIGEAQLQTVRIDQDFRTGVVKDLGEAQGKEAELAERAVAAGDMLDRIEVRAPTSGVVHQLAAHTLGGVIRAGDTIMQIVPDFDELQIEARLPPNDIDQVRTGQKAFIRFSAFNQRTTPQLIGNVSFVSADTVRDQQTNAPYFTVRVTLPDDERRRLAGLQLVPGMPAEVFMQTGSRTMMSYLLKPIADQLERSFIER